MLQYFTFPNNFFEQQTCLTLGLFTGINIWYGKIVGKYDHCTFSFLTIEPIFVMKMKLKTIDHHNGSLLVQYKKFSTKSQHFHCILLS